MLKKKHNNLFSQFWRQEVPIKELSGLISYEASLACVHAEREISFISFLRSSVLSHLDSTLMTSFIC